MNSQKGNNMYPYPTQNYQIPQFPTFNSMTSTIPEVQYVPSSESVDAFNIPPNKTAVWFNENKDELYIIRTDASGSRVKKEFTYKEKAKDARLEYVTRGEFEDFKAEYEEVIKNANKAPKKASQKATGVTEDE